MRRVKGIIEPLIIPQEKLDELKAVLENPKSPELHKNTMMRHIGACLVCRHVGACLVCRQMATQIVIYRMFGVTKIEKYCDECLERMQT
jgi:hypothetical protein